MKPIIATGTQRSGTTMLYQVLQSSPEIWAQNELHPIHRLIFGDANSNTNATLKRELGALLSRDLSGYEIGQGKLDRIRFFRELMEELAGEAGKSRWCLKDPQATYFLDEYADAFPTAKFLIMIRDPRAVVRSYLDPRGFRVGRPANTIVGADRWRTEVSKQLDFIGRHADRALLIKYESLVSDFPRQLDRISAFLNVAADDSMLNYYRGDANTRIHDGNENILQPPDPSKVDAWRSQLLKSQIGIIESRTHQLMGEMHYERDFPLQHISSLRSKIAHLHHRVVYEYRWQRYKLTGKS